MTLYEFFSLMGGVGLFLYGMSLTPGDVGHQVANTHSIFAVLAVLLELPFAEAIVALSRKVVPVLPEESRAAEDRKLKYLLQTAELPSSVAIQQAKLELARMGKLARNSLANAVQCFFAQDDRMAQEVLEAEDTVDILTDKIQEQLIAFRSRDYAPNEAAKLSQLVLAASDIERISDYAENIAEYEAAAKERKAIMSEEGLKELNIISEVALKSVDLALQIFETEAFDSLQEAEQLEQQVDVLKDA